MTTTIQLRRASASAWTSANPVLALGEAGVETDTYKIKIGDGTSLWSELEYFVHSWADLTGKPAVIAAGATKADARAAIDAASLDGSGLVPSSQLPSYVDDVLEYANFAGFPGTGATGKIYIALDTSKSWRWSGSTYVEIVASPGTTDAITEGSTNLFYTNARAESAIGALKGAANGYAGLDGSSKVAIANLPTGTTSSTVCIGNDSRLSDARTPTAAGQVADLSIVAFGANTARAASSYGDFPFGVKLQRALTLTSVTYRAATADASGNLVVELRKNGSTVSGSSATIAAANQVAGGTATGTWSFATGDIVTVYVTGVGTTPGKGLIADITGVTA